jgi:hypothetical protein
MRSKSTINHHHGTSTADTREWEKPKQIGRKRKRTEIGAKIHARQYPDGQIWLHFTDDFEEVVEGEVGFL